MVDNALDIINEIVFPNEQIKNYFLVNRDVKLAGFFNQCQHPDMVDLFSKFLAATSSEERQQYKDAFDKKRVEIEAEEMRQIEEAGQASQESLKELEEIQRKAQEEEAAAEEKAKWERFNEQMDYFAKQNPLKDWSRASKEDDETAEKIDLSDFGTNRRHM